MFHFNIVCLCASIITFSVLESADIDVIVIHDAVRPFVAGRLIDQIVQDAQVHGVGFGCCS